MTQRLVSEERRARETAKILYLNYKGETAVRTILPHRVWFGSTQWHPEPQWFLKAWDMDKGEDRDFAMKDIKAWGVE